MTRIGSEYFKRTVSSDCVSVDLLENCPTFSDYILTWIANSLCGCYVGFGFLRNYELL